MRSNSISNRARFRWNHLFNLLYLFVLALLLACLLSLVWLIVTHDDSIDMKQGELPGTLFGLLLTGIAMSVASAIIIPRIALRQAVEEGIREALVEVKREVKEQFDKEADTRYANETTRVDAHLSRMVAHFLIQNGNGSPDALWAMGWILRSARRYHKLESGRVDLTSYSDFAKSLLDMANLATAKLRATGGVTDELQLTIVNAQAIMKTNMMNAQPRVQESEVRKVIRFLKDFFDLEMALIAELERNRPVPAPFERFFGTRTDHPIPVHPSRQPLFQMMALYQRHTVAFFDAIHKDADYDKWRNNLTNEINKISYTTIWEGSYGTPYERRLREFEDQIEERASTMFDDASARYTAVSEMRKGETFEMEFLLDAGQPKKYKIVLGSS